MDASTGPERQVTLLVPVNITIKKEGDPDPSPSMSATNGVLVKTGDTLEIRFDDIPAEQFPLPASDIVWKYRQLKQNVMPDSDESYFTD